MKTEIHIGLLIQKKMKDERRSASWLADQLNCDRSNIYKMYKKSNMDIIQLLRICEILNHNLLNDISIIIFE